MSDYIQQCDPINFADEAKIILEKANKWIGTACAFNKSTEKKKEKRPN